MRLQELPSVPSPVTALSAVAPEPSSSVTVESASRTPLIMEKHIGSENSIGSKRKVKFLSELTDPSMQRPKILTALMQSEFSSHAEPTESLLQKERNEFVTITEPIFDARTHAVHLDGLMCIGSQTRRGDDAQSVLYLQPCLFSHPATAMLGKVAQSQHRTGLPLRSFHASLHKLPIAVKICSRLKLPPF
jgi:hypothetical protein